MKKLLIHICCAPCFIAPYTHLKESSEYKLYGFWFNPNIHPYSEYLKRRDCLKDFADRENIHMIWKDEYNLEKFLQNVSYREANRCSYCYYERLKYTAIVARKGKFDGFTSTLLYSKMQNHSQMKEVAESLAKEYNVPFIYQDFREYWKEGINLSKEQNMYRQQYCGCIYSEKLRYFKESNVLR
ncbi:MAG: hypothetical protein CSB55_08885 [Candidatus Cloacimonadota bacterium]|nr:MAG: hypothetical protein CSB55_08885 [Candidatus Cloacimonadota bacterium]